MSWVLLFLAVIFEIFWAICIHYSKGFTVLVPSALAALFAILSFILLTLSVKEIPVGVAYAVWTGLGVLGATSFGLYVSGESFNFKYVIFAGFVLVGVIGLSVTGEH